MKLKAMTIREVEEMFKYKGNKQKKIQALDLFGSASILDKILIFEEDFITKPYECSEGKLTVGIGNALLDVKEKSISDCLTDSLVIRMELERELKHFMDERGIEVNFYRYLALMNMAYNLGVPRLKKFKRMWKALEKEDYERASFEALDSKWARQVPNRARRIAEVLKTGEQHPAYML